MAPQLSFSVRRHSPVLVAPADRTPRELKRLSDIDDQQLLRVQIPFVHFYRRDLSAAAEDEDPAGVIRDALARALVLYYPFAGRLREGPDRKLVVDCTGEGVLFVEADADVRLEHFGEELLPPFSCLDELVVDMDDCSDIINSPLLVFQVTRLLCGGFILGMKFNHVICDGYGLVQFLTAVAELARAFPAPPPCAPCGPASAWRRATRRAPPTPTRSIGWSTLVLSPSTLSTAQLSAYFPSAPRHPCPPEPPSPRPTRRLHDLPAPHGFHLESPRSRASPPAGGGGHPRRRGRRSQKTQQAAASRLLRQCPCLPGGDHHGREAQQKPTRLRCGANQEGGGRRRRRVRPVDGRFVGAARAAACHGSRCRVAGPMGSLGSLYLGGKNSNGDPVIVVPIRLPAQAMERFAAEVDRLMNESAGIEKRQDRISSSSSTNTAVKPAL
uniref:Benzyl alcohol O-benzoyltransferase n=1 Tax=Ananas comosus var. bracteatus TaxID=296719 RepID=A0A6V7Q575_ANACO|nr:unnamed protein product [Ananas comosus var. bracteatus]